MATSPVILIAPSAVAGGLKTEADLLKDVLLFADTDLVHAVQAIMNHHPSFVVLQREARVAYEAYRPQMCTAPRC